MFLRNVGKFLLGDIVSHTKKVSSAIQKTLNVLHWTVSRPTAAVQNGAVCAPVGLHGTSHCVLIIHRGASPLAVHIRAPPSPPSLKLIFRLYSKYVNLVNQATAASLYIISNP
jgi:hypothetical protein